LIVLHDRIAVVICTTTATEALPNDAALFWKSSHEVEIRDLVICASRQRVDRIAQVYPLHVMIGSNVAGRVRRRDARLRIDRRADYGCGHFNQGGWRTDSPFSQGIDEFAIGVSDGLRSAGFEISSTARRLLGRARVEHFAEWFSGFVVVDSLANLGSILLGRFAPALSH
jgi:hypothetical protein